MSEEKRKFVRVNYATNIKWENLTAHVKGTSFIPDVTKDISAGGVRLVLDEPVAINDELNLEFTLPVQKAMSVKGRVKWVNEFKDDAVGAVKRHIGIEFVDISESDRDFIDKLVMRLRASQ